ncbi:FxsA family protein [Nocardioides nanhaiensis]|uniref:FxsA family protein n=1 Tax=Nocardioides nanhaiensis TaxID=1476871 RepID=A0ABP8WP55_9ACTN
MTAGGPTAAAPRRRRLPWVIVAALVVVPLLEIYVLVQVGQVIGAWWTIGLLLLASIVGGWLIKREGVRTFRALNTAIREGRVPATELADAGLVLMGGTLMLAPGFLTDAVGVLLVLPVTRPVFRRLLSAAIARRMLVPGGASGGLGGGLGGFGVGGPGTAQPPGGRRPGPGAGPVVQGEVVDDDPRSG